VTDDQLKGAPKFIQDDWDFGDRVQEAQLLGYYGYPLYW
jgi:hypothetical protein